MNPINLPEINSIADAIQAETQTGPTDETKHLRMLRGVYSLRNRPGQYLIRLRIPGGRITPDQLRAVADWTEKRANLGFAHLTTRQGIEIPGVAGEHIRELLLGLEATGLTTRRTGGNGVRSIVCCPLSGLPETEGWDVSPWAQALDRWYRDLPHEDFPRKIKIAFECCATDHVRGWATDIGLYSALQHGRRGFRILLGGGLGAIPMAGQPLEAFTPEDRLFSTIESVLHVFGQFGNRNSRARSRLKWLIRDWGIERFARAVIEDRERRTGPPEAFKAIFKEESSRLAAPMSRDFHGVLVRCPRADLSPMRLRELAEVAEQFGAEVRITLDQNLLFRGVAKEVLADFHACLAGCHLDDSNAGLLPDVVRCAGAGTCLSAITNPKPLAGELETGLSSLAAEFPLLRPMRVHISGCPNSCSHHPAADLGLYGTARRAQDGVVPHYVLVAGAQGSAQHFGVRIAEVPARRSAEAVQRLLRKYAVDRRPDEDLESYVSRVGPAALREVVSDLAVIPARSLAPELFRDVGMDHDFKIEAKEGECHA